MATGTAPPMTARAQEEEPVRDAADASQNGPTRRWTRRALLHTWGGAAIAATLLSACGPAAPPTQAPPAAATAAPQAPAKPTQASAAKPAAAGGTPKDGGIFRFSIW